MQAAVHDGGQTASGRPYFVMELVKGLPITAYCDQAGLTPRERLGLFLHLCQAVQHAHQKGVIHRDLKPSNVLVTLHDGTPLVKVIDFGIAKALGQDLTDKTLFTGFAQLVGTALYMSLEQAALSNVDVDTRSDVDALGVLLYELLTGTTPFDKDRLKELGYDELRRVIREEEPPKPSMRISTLGRAATTLSTRRRSDPKRLSQLCRGELDWIVMKALEKDRSRRYESASALAADVQRYLADEPVLACPPSVWYHLRTFVRRNKAGLFMAATVGLAVLLAARSIGWVVRDRSARGARLNYRAQLAVEEAGLSRDRALRRTANPHEWAAALAAATSALKRAEELAAQDEAALDPAVAARLQALRARLEADETDHRFVARFDKILSELIVWDVRRSRAKDGEMFRKLIDAFQSHYGWDVGATPAADVVGMIRQHPAPIQEHLLTALDVCFAHVPGDNPQARQWLADVLQMADGDPWRKQAQRGLARADWRALETLLKEVDVPRQRPALLCVLASYLPEEAWDTKAALRDRLEGAYPGDFWAHNRFAVGLSQMILAWEMATSPDPDLRDERRALALAREAVRLAPNDGDFWNTLGVAYYRVGKPAEAVAALEKAIKLSQGGRGHDWFFLAMAHWQLGHRDAARKWYKRAVDWMTKKTHRDDLELRRFRAEAAALMKVGPNKD